MGAPPARYGLLGCGHRGDGEGRVVVAAPERRGRGRDGLGGRRRRGGRGGGRRHVLLARAAVGRVQVERAVRSYACRGQGEGVAGAQLAQHNFGPGGREVGRHARALKRAAGVEVNLRRHGRRRDALVGLPGGLLDADARAGDHGVDRGRGPGAGGRGEGDVRLVLAIFAHDDDRARDRTRAGPPDGEIDLIARDAVQCLRE